MRLHVSNEKLSDLSLKRLGYNCFNTDAQAVKDILMHYQKNNLPKAWHEMVEALELAHKLDKEGKVAQLAAISSTTEFERTVKVLVPFRPTGDMQAFTGCGKGKMVLSYSFTVLIY